MGWVNAGPTVVTGSLVLDSTVPCSLLPVCCWIAWLQEVVSALSWTEEPDTVWDWGTEK